jgi:uncharacterized protein YndB with AHSA1/START domain
MKDQSVIYGEFTIERSFNAPLSKLYQMFADKTTKEQWFKGPDSSDTEHTMDFRVGGSEFNSGKFHDDVTHVFKAYYYDIVPEQRIIYSYEMYLNDNRISVSLATIEFSADNDNSKLILRESGVFLDGYDTSQTRENGTRQLLNAIEAALNS